MRWLVALLICWAGMLAAENEQIVLGLSRDSVSISTTFDGTEILIFGAVRRDSPPPEGQLGVIITVEGPSGPVMVRRKERRFGIWVNADAVEVDSAPSFYAVATSGPLSEVLRNTEDLRNRITIHRAIRSVGATVMDSASFTEALIRIREKGGLYQVKESAVDLEEETLFRAVFGLPANLVEGDYEARIYLTRGGEIIDSYVTTIPVAKVGLERWLFHLSREQPAIYGALSLLLAIAAGWGAQAGFSLMRR